MNDQPTDQLKTLIQFLESDPENPALLADVAQAALAADQCRLAQETLERLDEVEPLAGQMANLAGIAAMRAGDQQTARRWFDVAQQDNPDDEGLIFNVAWSFALSGDFESSAELITLSLTDKLAQAAMLDVQISHELGRFEEAEAKMDRYIAKHPDYAPLHASVSVLAMDIDRPDLAKDAALKGGRHPDALTTLGALELGEHKLDEAEALFEQALANGHKSPRAEIGRGLVSLARQDYSSAASAIDKGAQQFSDHLGSWIAAGWAHLLAGDGEAAKERFRKALDTDDTFSEAHGSLAVMDVLGGDIEEGKRKAEIAMRLDRSSFSSALAGILIANANHNAEAAERILKRALSSKVLPGGETLEQAIIQSVSFGLGPNSYSS